jgi:hypothetical protein
MKSPKQPPSEELASDLLASELVLHLQYRLAGRVRDFCLICADGGVILRGYSRTYYAKQLAQHAVMQATDLPILANEIMVD